MSLDKNKEPFIQKLKTFYSVRLVRIYIPYLSSIFFSVLVLYWISNFSPDLYHVISGREFNTRLIIAHNDLSFYNFLKALLFEKNHEYIGFNYVYWSLLYEGLFYLIVPFIFLARKHYLVASCILYIAGMFIFNILHTTGVFIKFVFEYNFYFAIGQTTYYYKGGISEFLKSRKLKSWLILASITGYFIFDVLAIFHFEFWANFLSAITGGMLLILFYNYPIENNYFIEGIKKLGKISYSFYLFHVPSLIVVYTLLHKFTGKIVFYSHIYYPVGVVVSLLLGSVFYKLIEEPSMSLIKRIKNTSIVKSPSR